MLLQKKWCAIAADSRITWANGKHWDQGRKVFASHVFPEMLGYCGDAFFPTHVLGQIVETINLGLLLDVADNSVEKVERLKSVLARALAQYPANDSFSFELLYCTREGEGMDCVFRVFHLEFERNAIRLCEGVPLPEKSGEIKILGSGTDAVKSSMQKWQKSDVKQTSRAAFSAFCDAIGSNADPKSGGLPQLTGMQRIGGARICGIVHGDSRGICGVNLAPLESAGGIVWFNERFEHCDGTSGELRDGAQPQPRPRGLQPRV
jgi:hypothetical protein